MAKNYCALKPESERPNVEVRGSLPEQAQARTRLINWAFARKSCDPLRAAAAPGMVYPTGIRLRNGLAKAATNIAAHFWAGACYRPMVVARWRLRLMHGAAQRLDESWRIAVTAGREAMQSARRPEVSGS